MSDKNLRAQGTLEYVFLLIVIIVSLYIFGSYLRNAFSGSFRNAADTFGQGEVYRPFGGTSIR